MREGESASVVSGYSKSAVLSLYFILWTFLWRISSKEHTRSNIAHSLAGFYQNASKKEGAHDMWERTISKSSDMQRGRSPLSDLVTSLCTCMMHLCLRTIELKNHQNYGLDFQ